MQLKFWVKSFLPAWINSNTMVSTSALFQCQIAQSQAQEKVMQPQAWESNAIVSCCFVYLFSIKSTITSSRPHDQNGDRLACVSLLFAIFSICINAANRSKFILPAFKCVSIHFCCLMLHCGPTVDSYHWGLPLSSVFLSVIYSQKRQEGRCNQDNGRYFHTSLWIGLNIKESIEFRNSVQL